MVPPAMAAALGAYAPFLNLALPVLGVASAADVAFILINLWSVGKPANFPRLVILLSVGERLILSPWLRPLAKPKIYWHYIKGFGHEVYLQLLLRFGLSWLSRVWRWEPKK